MIVRRVTSVYGLLQLLAEDTEQLQQLRAVLQHDGRFPDSVREFRYFAPLADLHL